MIHEIFNVNNIHIMQIIMNFYSDVAIEGIATYIALKLV
jgi:hypothetical protein